ncbi:uncharacterized protein LOC105185041 [Harpegnathos saltator]|uniref:uncharacterized protein LOC105185041 n=1 Tax=Harpegnathos saltator TaxID=610380 RepID=UPI000DBEDE07|nr:uncharacterized protein LOC105185041 [Harpegnathos saltator]
MFFHDGSRGAPWETRVLVDGVHVQVGPTIKYLGLTLDSRWDFKAHFWRLVPRVRSAELVWLSPDRYRPKGDLDGGLAACIISLMRQAMWPVVVNAILGYHTVSYMVATTLAGSPPVELLAQERCTLYWRLRELCEEGEGLTVRGLAVLRSLARARTLERWSAILADPSGFGLRTTEAVHPSLPEVADRRGRGLSFHLVQVLIGHRCFGRYLHRIGKDPTMDCHHCSVSENTV